MLVVDLLTVVGHTFMILRVTSRRLAGKEPPMAPMNYRAPGRFHNVAESRALRSAYSCVGLRPTQGLVAAEMKKLSQVQLSALRQLA